MPVTQEDIKPFLSNYLPSYYSGNVGNKGGSQSHSGSTIGNLVGLGDPIGGLLLGGDLFGGLFGGGKDDRFKWTICLGKSK